VFVGQHQHTWLCLQIRKTLFDMMSTATGYSVDVGMTANTISSLRGNISATPSNTTPPNYADEGITTVSSPPNQVSLFPEQKALSLYKDILKQACSSFVVWQCDRCM